MSTSLAFHLFFARVNTLLDEHALNHKLCEKEISLEVRQCINENIWSLSREHESLFKCFCNYPTLTVAKHNKCKNAQNIVIFQVKKSKKKISELFSKAFKVFLKNLGQHQINCINCNNEIL